MSKQKPPAYSDYAIGYGRPPKATQFAPGNNANPKGRPKGSRSVGAVLLDIMKQKVPVTENGRRRHLPRLDVMLRNLADDAIRKDLAAVKFTVSLLDRYGESSEAPRRLADMLEEDRAILMRWAHGAIPSCRDADALSPPDRDDPSELDAADDDDAL
jgi:Family of unknown function (DUF5681)